MTQRCGRRRAAGYRPGLPDQRIWLDGQRFNVTGTPRPSPLAPDIDDSALIGYPAAQRLLGYLSIVRGEKTVGPPSTIDVRAAGRRSTARGERA